MQLHRSSYFYFKVIFLPGLFLLSRLGLRHTPALGRPSCGGLCFHSRGRNRWILCEVAAHALTQLPQLGDQGSEGGRQLGGVGISASHNVLPAATPSAPPPAARGAATPAPPPPPRGGRSGEGGEGGGGARPRPAAARHGEARRVVSVGAVDVRDRGRDEAGPHILDMRSADNGDAADSLEVAQAELDVVPQRGGGMSAILPRIEARQWPAGLLLGQADNEFPIIKHGACSRLQGYVGSTNQDDNTRRDVGDPANVERDGSDGIAAPKHHSSPRHGRRKQACRTPRSCPRGPGRPRSRQSYDSMMLWSMHQYAPPSRPQPC